MKTQRCHGGVRLLPERTAPFPANIHRLDHNALPMIYRMQRRGLQVDLTHFAKMDVELTHDMERVTDEIKTLTGFFINPGSGDQVSDLLFKKLGLKQAKIKMTSSGDRESAADEVLTAIQHEHPAVGKVLEYKEYEKLRGTYVRPMPKLARKTSHGVWRMYPNLKVSRVTSGRLACSEPNLLAMPTRTERGRDIRKGFITEAGWCYLSVDECLHPETPIKTLTGDISISQIKPGDKVLTLRDEHIKWGTVTKSSWIEPKPAYKITFDTGEYVIASSTHKWPVQMTPPNSLSVLQAIETQHLRLWDRMTPCTDGMSSAGYPTWYAHRGSFKYSFKHHLVADAYLGSRPEGNHVHHKDEDKTNYKPTNLEYVDGPTHTATHGRQNYPKQDHEYRLQRLREGIKNRQSYEGEANPNSKLSEIDLDVISELVIQDDWTATQVANYFKLSYGHSRRLVKKIWAKAMANHKVVDIQYVGVQPMWAITVEPDHNYVLGCGVVTFNSQIEVRIAAHRSKDTNLCNVYRNKEDVYSDFATSAFRLQDKRYQDETGVWKYPTVDKMEHRRPSKTCVLAAIYDVTAGGLQSQMPVVCANCNKLAGEHDCSIFKPLWTEQKCQELLNSFYMRYPGLMKMRLDDHAYMRKWAYIVCCWGRVLHVQAVRSVLEWVVSGALREGSNHPMQCGAQGTIKLTTAAVDSILAQSGMYGDVCYPLLQIHDELLFECREDMAQEIGELVKWQFENIVRLEVPIEASTVTAESWGTLAK